MFCITKRKIYIFIKKKKIMDNMQNLFGIQFLLQFFTTKIFKMHGKFRTNKTVKFFMDQFGEIF